MIGIETVVCPEFVGQNSVNGKDRKKQSEPLLKTRKVVYFKVIVFDKWTRPDHGIAS